MGFVWDKNTLFTKSTQILTNQLTVLGKGSSIWPK
jgi:hypothetical protein